MSIWATGSGAEVLAKDLAGLGVVFFDMVGTCAQHAAADVEMLSRGSGEHLLQWLPRESAAIGCYTLWRDVPQCSK